MTGGSTAAREQNHHTPTQTHASNRQLRATHMPRVLIASREILNLWGNPQSGYAEHGH